MDINSENSRELLQQLVEQYCSTQRHPSLPPFTIQAYTHESWRQAPCRAKAGCYALYAEGQRLIYIGKASHGASIGTRLGVHLDKIRNGVSKDHRWFEREPRFVDIIEVVEPFEAPSLEEYLQSRWLGYNDL
jgi:excinuclease UvrABC nuclease subunit